MTEMNEDFEGTPACEDDDCEECKEEKPEENNPIDMLDVTRKARQEALLSLREVLSSTMSKYDKKLSNKGAFKALNNLHVYTTCLEGLVTALLADLYRTVQAVTVLQQNSYGLSLNLQALVRDLSKKNFTTVEELQAILQNEILPENIKAMEKQTESENQTEKAE